MKCYRRDYVSCVVKDDIKTVEWFVKAAEQKYIMAQYKLGFMPPL